MRKINFLVKSLLVSLLLLAGNIVFAHAVNAATLKFDPASVTAQNGQDFTIKVVIDTGSTSVLAADAVVTFPSSDIDLKNVASGGFFPVFSSPSGSGTIEIKASQNSAAGKSGSGTLATITFTSKKDSGSGGIFFGTSGNDITDGVNNILDKNALNQVALSYSAGGSGDNNGGNGGNSGGNSQPNSCGGTCGSDSNCQGGLYCYSGYCRNPQCGGQTNCVCPTASPTPRATATPAAGGETEPSPTPQIVALSDYSPDNGPIETDESAQNQTEATPTLIDTVKTYIPYLAIALIAIALILFILNKVKKGGGNPPQITPPASNTPPTTFTSTGTFGTPQNMMSTAPLSPQIPLSAPPIFQNPVIPQNPPVQQVPTVPQTPPAPEVPPAAPINTQFPLNPTPADTSFVNQPIPPENPPAPSNPVM